MQPSAGQCAELSAFRDHGCGGGAAQCRFHRGPAFLVTGAAQLDQPGRVETQPDQARRIQISAWCNPHYRARIVHPRQQPGEEGSRNSAGFSFDAGTFNDVQRTQRQTPAQRRIHRPPIQCQNAVARR